MKKGILLDIGCRDRKQPNFTGMDWIKRPEVDIVKNLEEFPYPFEDESCLTIKCAHVIEHIKPWFVINFMDELWRILLPEGQLAISAPYGGSKGYLQDPTHCTNITETTWKYFCIDSPLYDHYKPKPWKIEHLVYKPDGNIEAILRKATATDGIMSITTEAIKIGALQKPSELASFLMFLEKKELKVIVEIGTSRGGVFYTFCKIADNDATIVSIDLPGGHYSGGQSEVDVKTLKTYARSKQKLHFIKFNSQLDSTRDKLLKILNKRKIDLLFIDGDHRYKGVKRDWELYYPLVREGGFIAFHDICTHPAVANCHVEKLWKELKPKHSVAEFVDLTQANWGGIGLIIK